MRTSVLSMLMAAGIAFMAGTAVRADVSDEKAVLHPTSAKAVPLPPLDLKRRAREPMERLVETTRPRAVCDWLGCPGLIVFGVGF